MANKKRFSKNIYCVFCDGNCVGVFSHARSAIETCDVFPGSVIKIISWSLLCRLMRSNLF